MANVDENLNLGEINQNIPTLIMNQFEKLYNELEERWRQQAHQINQKPDVHFNKRNNANYTPAPSVSLTQFREGTIYIDLVPATPTVWMLTSKIQVVVPPAEIQSVWIQLG